MEEWINYLINEEGKEVIFTRRGFISYVLNGKEFFICDFFISEEYRGNGHGLSLAELAEQKAKQLGCEAMTCNIFINNKNKKAFAYKVRAFSNFGFLPSTANNNVVTMIKEL